MSKHAAPELPPDDRYITLYATAQTELGWLTQDRELKDGLVDAVLFGGPKGRKRRLSFDTLQKALEGDYGENELVHVHLPPLDSKLARKPFIEVKGSIDTFEQVVCKLAALTLPEPPLHGRHAPRKEKQ